MNYKNFFIRNLFRMIKIGQKAVDFMFSSNTSLAKIVVRPYPLAL